MRGVAAGLILLSLFAPGWASEADWEDCKADNPERSIAGCTRIISEAKEPENVLAIAYNNRGVAYKAKGEILRAFADYTEAVRLNPAYARAFYNRGLAYLEMKAFARALDDYDTALRIDPNFAKAFASRAMLLAEHGEIEEALQDFQKALALEGNLKLPPDEELAAKIVVALPHQEGPGTSERRILILTVAIKLDPENAELYNSRAAAHFASRAFGDAVSDLNEAIRLSPDYAEAFLNRCRAYLELSDSSRALDDCDQAIELSPDSGPAYLGRGIVNLRRSKMAEAQQDFSRAIGLTPDSLRAYILRGQTYEKLRQRREAIADYQTVFTMALQAPTQDDLNDKAEAQAALKRLGALPPGTAGPTAGTGPAAGTGPSSGATQATAREPPKLPEPPLVAAVAKCDDMAAFQFDLDRPGASKWQDSHTKISPLPDAFSVCETALQATEALPEGPGKKQQLRRVMVELGRVHAAKAYADAMSGNRSAAQSALAAAMALWTKAAKLDSGQAFNLLGSYYAGAFAANDAKPDPFVPADTPNLHLAWVNYQEAARLKNPTALVNVGLILTGVDRRAWNLPSRDEKKGREYLEEAQRMEVPAAYYGLGVAMIQGIGTFPKNPATEDEGVRLLGIAYCKGVPGAIELFERSRKYKKPAQCEG